MKNLLEELKKLDNGVNPPADFKERVMGRISQLKKKEEKKALSGMTIKKYVIPTLTAAAMVMIACMVTLKNKKVKNLHADVSDYDQILSQESFSACRRNCRSQYT